MRDDDLQLSLVWQAKNGNAQALNALLDANKGKIYAAAYALLKNREDAEDAMQQALIAVWQNIGKLAAPEAFETWLYRVTYTRSLNILKSRKNNEMVIENDIGDMPQAALLESELMLPHEYAERNDLRERLFLIIDSLSPVQRETVVLYYFHDKSVGEISEIMDCSENTVKSRLYLARHSIKTRIEEQERKSGERFYGVAVGVLPIGYFVEEHIKQNLPPAGTLGHPATTAQQAGTNAAPQVAAKTAAKGMTTAIKTVLAVVGIAAVAVVGIMTAKLVADSQNKGASAPIDTQTPVEAEVFTEKPTEAATEPLTEAPTESYVDAYRGYLEVLENHKSDIEAYDWQLGDDESRPVVFADIAGDETPEMIVVCCNPTLSTTVSSFLNIFQYKDNSVKQVYSMDNSKTDGFFQLDYNGPGGLNIFVLFQEKNNKELCLHRAQIDGSFSEDIYSFVESEGRLSARKKASYSKPFAVDTQPKVEIDSAAVTEDMFFSKLDEINKNTSTVLMRSNADTAIERAKYIKDMMESHENQALTYDEAVAYLKKQMGESSGTNDNSSEEAYSVIAGRYTTSFSRHFQSSLKIDSNGMFETEYYYDPKETKGQGSITDPAVYSLFRGKIENLTKTGDYTYTFHITDVSYDYPVGESGDITYTDILTHTEKSMHAGFVKHPFETEGTMTLYAKGLTPSDMKESHFTSYIFPDNPKTSERARSPIAHNIIYIPTHSQDHPYYGQ